VLEESRCAGCHRDHKGRAMAPRAQQLCTDCHGAGRHGEIPQATDFATDHPKFGLPAVELSNLKFNHTLHLDPAGVRDPQAAAATAAAAARGVRRVLTCDRCHQPEKDGALMAPVSMEKHCRQCHALSFDPQMTRRQVPHGPVKEVETMLREFYARLVLGDIPPGVVPPRDLPRVRPGAAPTSEERRAAMQVADERAQRAMRELMRTRAVCSTCHHVSRSAAGEWRVAEVKVAREWMPASTFTHAKHGAQGCLGCHDVRGSRRAEDISMPEIARCRECHAGVAETPGKVASDCATCHRFHAGRGAWR
jgi:predicted CXXCH cytochrome family protein